MTETLDFRDPDWVAEQLNIDKNAVYRYLSDGTLPGLQLGRKWLISESSLVAHLKAEEKRQTEWRRKVILSDPEFSSVFDRFSLGARRVLVTAQKEAMARNHTYIGQEHMTLAIALVPGSAGLAVLQGLGISAERLRTEVESVTPAANRSVVEGEIGLTPRARRAIELADEDSRTLGHDYIGVEHLVLGLLREGGGLGHAVLTELGVTVDNARAEMQRYLEVLRVARHGHPGETGDDAPESRSEEAEIEAGP